MQIYAEAESRAKIFAAPFGDIKNEVTDVRSLRDANLFAAAEACGICGCRKATVYLQIGYGQATGTALPRRNSICGKQSDAEYTRKFRHLNRNKTRKIYRNSLRNFPLYGFSKHLHRFRCSGEGEHLNPAERQNPATNPLTTNALQDFRRLCPWFRSQTAWNTAERKCALEVLRQGYPPNAQQNSTCI